MPDRLIIGWGNTTRGDDGAGYIAAERLGGLALPQLTPEIAADIAQARVVIFIDADSSLPQGEWHAGVLAAEQSGAPSTHACPPALLLSIASVLYGHAPPAVLIRIGAGQFGHGEPLSPAVAAAVNQVIAYVGIE